MIPRQRLLLSDWYRQYASDNPLIICDVGAREELFRPYNQLPQELFRIYGFEPDIQEAERLKKKYANTNRTYLPYGLWKSNTKVQLSYAELAGNSSIHPPNLEVLSKTFPPSHWENRTPKKEIEIGVKALDEIANDLNNHIDLLKVDTQGSEFEIIQGAENILKDSVVMVLLETWTFEVHKGQALSGKIMEWMHDLGFELVRTNNAADWHRKEINQLNRKGLRTLVGLDLLFIRKSFEFQSEEKTLNKLIQGAALAELYGFPDLALQIIDQNQGRISKGQQELKMARDIIIDNWSRSHEPILFRGIRKLISYLGYSLEKHHSDPYAPLH